MIKSLLLLGLLCLAVAPSISGMSQNEITKLVVEPELTSIKMNHPICLNWYILTKNQLLSVDVLKFPKIKGGEIIPTDPVKKLEFKSVSINGVKYMKGLFFTQSIKSSVPGKMEIGPLTLKINEAEPNKNGNPFPIAKPKIEEIKSSSIEISVIE